MKIFIPEPCHENWQNMLPSDKGRFCLSCQKEVIDFSVMTKHEIEAYFKAKLQNVCGRFKENQLTDINRELPAINTKLSLKPWWMAASLFVFAKSSFSQGNNLAIDSTKQNIELNKDVVKIKKEKVDKQHFKYILKGKVVDKETGEGIIGATISIKDINIGAITDYKGNYQLNLPVDFDTLKVNIKTFGYESFDTVLLPGQDLNVELREYIGMLGGAIMVSGGISYKPSIWRRIGNFFARPFRRRY